MGAQRGGIFRAILRPRFDELSARRILSDETLGHEHLMRASASEDSTPDDELQTESHSEEASAYQRS